MDTTYKIKHSINKIELFLIIVSIQLIISILVGSIIGIPFRRTSIIEINAKNKYNDMVIKCILEYPNLYMIGNNIENKKKLKVIHVIKLTYVMSQYS